MPYSTDNAKWKAYQFSDPFAAGAFIVCNKISQTFCRPDCDGRRITNLKAEIKFVDQASTALAYGYSPCSSCDPMNPPSIDTNLLIHCVTSVNKKIGFMSPLMDENEDKNNERIKENILGSRKAPKQQQPPQVVSKAAGRRASVPVVNFEGKYSKDFENASLSKNDSDHYRLVDLACRHLALAAAVNVYLLKYPKMSTASPEDTSAATGGSSPGKKRRRRGGVLGFKELAAKSKLSAWHFHRVFKSVTSYTPKTYGDKCAEFLKHAQEKNETGYSSTLSSAYETPVSQDSATSHPSTPAEVSLTNNKRLRLDNDFDSPMMPPSKRGPTSIKQQQPPLAAILFNQQSFNNTQPPTATDPLDLGFQVPIKNEFDITYNNNNNNNIAKPTTTTYSSETEGTSSLEFEDILDNNMLNMYFNNADQRGTSEPNMSPYDSTGAATFLPTMAPPTQNLFAPEFDFDGPSSLTNSSSLASMDAFSTLDTTFPMNTVNAPVLGSDFNFYDGTNNEVVDPSSMFKTHWNAGYSDENPQIVNLGL